MVIETQEDIDKFYEMLRNGAIKINSDSNPNIDEYVVKDSFIIRDKNPKEIHRRF